MILSYWCKAADTGRSAPPIHYMSRDHDIAHELTNHILHPSPAPGLRSPGATENRLRRWCGIVAVSPTGTRGSFPRICSTGMT